ncbi:hypothetical protein CRUP_034057 [Coryphaenoides rupestris]|nr:hypothetical protein CRUP_034057 [Coryphaenoides rupestris]
MEQRQSSQNMPLHHATQVAPLHHATTQVVPLHHATTQVAPLHHATTQVAPLHHATTQVVPLHHATMQVAPLHHATQEATKATPKQAPALGCSRPRVATKPFSQGKWPRVKSFSQAKRLWVKSSSQAKRLWVKSSSQAKRLWVKSSSQANCYTELPVEVKDPEILASTRIVMTMLMILEGPQARQSILHGNRRISWSGISASTSLASRAMLSTWFPGTSHRPTASDRGGERYQTKDMTASVAKKRADVADVKRSLYEKQVKYSLLFPAHLRVEYRGEKKVFESPKDAQGFYDSHFRNR